jgi:hypothetical protein
MYPMQESNTQSVVAVQQNDVILVSDRRFCFERGKVGGSRGQSIKPGESGEHLGETPHPGGILRPLSDAPSPPLACI